MRPDIYTHLPVSFRAARERYLQTVILLRELREHILLRVGDPTPPWFLQKIVGFADTSLGLGFVVKAERGPDGNYADSLSAISKSGHMDGAMRTQLDEFFEALLASPVVAGDIRLSNIVYAHNPERGGHFVLIDGLGDKTGIPIQRLIPGLNRFLKRRRIAVRRAKLASRIGTL
jgi:hypothetical protein